MGEARRRKKSPGYTTMIPITFYNFAKKPNSTKQPDVNGTTADCELIEDTSIINPKIRWHEPAVPAVNVYDFNYCYIAIFQRYYFVTDIKYELGAWVVSLTVDLLATARDIIGPSSQYILRSAYTFDGAVVDDLYPVKSDFETATYYVTDSGHQGALEPVYCDIDDLGQWYVVGIIGSILGAENNNGSVTYYVLSQGQFNAALHYILGTISIYGVPQSELSLELQRQLLNPMQYIASVMLLPFKPSCVQENSSDKLYTSIQLGMTDIDLTAIGGFRMLKRASSYSDIYGDTHSGWISHHSTQAAVYLHPQYSDRGKWVLGQPYSKYHIVVEPWGTIEIPGNVVLEAYKALDSQDRPYFNIYFHSYFDASTGACRLEISTSNESGNVVPFYMETVNLGIDVPCHQAVQDVMTYRQTAFDLAYAKKDMQLNTAFGIAQAATFGILGGASGSAGMAGSGLLGGAKQAYSEPLQYYYHQQPAAIHTLEAANYPTITGSGSSKDTYMTQARDLCSPRIFAYWAILVDDNNTDHGRPLCSIRQISNIPGFIICDNAHIESRLTAAENNAIEDYMNGGFYYE